MASEDPITVSENSEARMLDSWLKYEERGNVEYKFEVMAATEKLKPDDLIINYLARQLILAHQSPEMLKVEYQLLVEDTEDVDLLILKQYVEEEILPSTDRVPTRVGNFGEILAAIMLMEFEDYWFPIYKLRFRVKKDWSMRLTDICLFKTDGLEKPLVCFGEVKTKSTGCDKKLAVKGHSSLSKDNALDYPEILRFICTWLFEKGMRSEAELLSRIRLDKIAYDKKHRLFLVHNKNDWTDEILEKLEECKLDERLVDFTLIIVLIVDLRAVIDEVYSRAWIGAKEVLSG